MPRQVTNFLLQGGLDLVTSPIAVQQGRIWTGLNYEAAEAGYRRIRGYERHDGRPRPSEAGYWILPRSGAAAAVGDTIKGEDRSSATPARATRPTAVVLAVTDAAYILGELVGVFAAGETMTDQDDAAAGTATAVADSFGASTAALDLAYRDLAATHRRISIEAVPGSGHIRGVWFYQNELYAFRDNAAGDAGVMHKATATGWAAVSLGIAVPFDTGRHATAPQPGARISTAGGFKGTLAHASLSSGTWEGNDAAGTLYLGAITGTVSNNDQLQIGEAGSTANLAMVMGASAATTLPAGGRYEFRNRNFGFQAGNDVMLGVNGAGPAFIYDGVALVPLSTGHTDDRPTHLAIHANHLLLGYRGGSIIVSFPGDPYRVSGSDATEILAGQSILGFEEGAGQGDTVVIGDDRIQVLYGRVFTTDGDVQLRDQSSAQTGAVEWTAQSVGMPIFMDNRGVRSVETTEAYGNFVIGTLTEAIQPWLNRQIGALNRPTASMRIRASDQYRLFLDSGIGLILFMGRGTPEISFINYGVPVRCAVSAEDANRIERVYFGSDDGWVFEAERGRSFDGQTIAAYCRLPLNFVGDPVRQKRWFSTDLHLDLDSEIKLEVSALFEDGINPEQLITDEAIQGGGTLWEEGLYEEGYYNAPLNGYASFDTKGIGRNMSLLVRSATKIEAPHTLNGVSIHYAPRRIERR